MLLAVLSVSCFDVVALPAKLDSLRLDKLLREQGHAEIVKVSSVCSVDKLPKGFYNSGMPATNSFIQGAHSRLYQAGFDTNNWSGQLSAFAFKKGDFSHLLWKTQLDSVSNPVIYSYNPVLSGKKGIKLEWDNISASQKKRLNPLGDEVLAKARLDWLYGKKETSKKPLLRVRDHYLADIIHSNIVFKGRYQDYAYSQLKGNEGSQYNDFLAEKQVSQEALFVNSNDGLLHAINAETGKLLFSYFAESSLNKVAQISDPQYGCKATGCIPHEYVADGLASLGDAYFDTKWHSILVNNLGIGGKAIYALDVSQPDHFTDKQVLWEISTTQSPDHTDVFAKYLGFSQQKINVVRLQNGRWAAIFANGYRSASQQAVLFIVDIESGHLIRAIETKKGDAKNSNGLSPVTAVDRDEDGSIDTVYAGDLQGNLWAFDLSQSDSAQWGVKYGSVAEPQPLFRACIDAACDKSQVITQALEVGRQGSKDLIVFFGTGYTDAIARLLAQPQKKINSIYGVVDKGEVLISRSTLLQQKILYETNYNSLTKVRIHSNKKVDYGYQNGWYLDLYGSAVKSSSERESLYSPPVLHDGVLMVNTVVEDSTQCGWKRKSWLMRLNAKHGARLGAVHFDLNNDKYFSDQDNIDFNNISTVVSALQVDSVASQGTTIPILRVNANKEVLYITTDKGSVQVKEMASSYFMGRQSWRKL